MAPSLIIWGMGICHWPPSMPPPPDPSTTLSRAAVQLACFEKGHLKAMLGEEALVHPDHQRRRLENREEAKADLRGLQLAFGGLIEAERLCHFPEIYGSVACQSSHSTAQR